MEAEEPNLPTKIMETASAAKTLTCDMGLTRIRPNYRAFKDTFFGSISGVDGKSGLGGHFKMISDWPFPGHPNVGAHLGR